MLSKYRVWCEDESAYFETWLETDPTTCPNNNTHTITTSKTSIIESREDEPQKDPSGKLRVQSSSRQIGTMTYFTGVGDDATDITKVGGGQRIIYDHQIGGDALHAQYIEINCVENETWIHEGYIEWVSCKFDTVSLSVVPRLTGTEAGADTNYNLYGGYMIVPAAGDGTLSITSDITTPIGGLVYMPDSETGVNPTAFWNADWNSTTKEFENITAAPTGNGRYNMFTVEVTFSKFVNQIPLLASGFEMLQASDVTQVGQGMRLKAEYETYGTDHDWQVACLLTLNRQRTA